MTKEQAIEILENAINAGSLKGVYSLADTSIILQALVKVSELVEIVPSVEE
jgi:ferric-dicitrate binding protein FerR (iron transport regulator)